MRKEIIINALSNYKNEVMEILLLDQLWMTTGDQEYAIKCENKLQELAEKVTRDVCAPDKFDRVHNIVGDFIEEQKQSL